MVVQPGERNAFDQRWIEYNLLKKYVGSFDTLESGECSTKGRIRLINDRTFRHGVVLIRRTLAEIADHGRLDSSTKALYM